MFYILNIIYIYIYIYIYIWISLLHINLPFFCVSMLCCLSFFCDGHLLSGSRWGCNFRGTSGGWGATY